MVSWYGDLRLKSPQQWKVSFLLLLPLPPTRVRDRHLTSAERETTFSGNYGPIQRRCHLKFDHWNFAYGLPLVQRTQKPTTREQPQIRTAASGVISIYLTRVNSILCCMYCCTTSRVVHSKSLLRCSRCGRSRTCLSLTAMQDSDPRPSHA